jgi:hypothetical protein
MRDVSRYSFSSTRSFPRLFSQIIVTVVSLVRPWRVQVSAFTAPLSQSTRQPPYLSMIAGIGIQRNRTFDKSMMNRSKFLSATAATFLTSTSSFVVVMANHPDECQAKSPRKVDIENHPRYIERELEMTYGTDPNGNPRTRGVLVRRLTGDATPYTFPVSPIRLVKEWPDEAPPFRPEDFFRTDSNDDGWFYKVPRLVYHIDEPAVASLTQYYRNNIAPHSDILDICSSWV